VKLIDFIAECCCGISHICNVRRYLAAKAIKRGQQITLYRVSDQMKNGHKLNLVHLARRIETNSNQSGQFYTVRASVVGVIMLVFCHFFWFRTYLFASMEIEIKQFSFVVKSKPFKLY
jgi:hypothetical protein